MVTQRIGNRSADPRCLSARRHEKTPRAARALHPPGRERRGRGPRHQARLLRGPPARLEGQLRARPGDRRADRGRGREQGAARGLPARRGAPDRRRRVVPGPDDARRARAPQRRRLHADLAADGVPGRAGPVQGRLRPPDGERRRLQARRRRGHVPVRPRPHGHDRGQPALHALHREGRRAHRARLGPRRLPGHPAAGRAQAARRDRARHRVHDRPQRHARARARSASSTSPARSSSR